MINLLFFIYVVGTLFIGFVSYKKIKGSEDFYVAGKKAGALAVSGSLLATSLGSSAILGSVDFASRNGWSGSWFMICAAIGFIALYFILDRLENFNGYTLPELLGTFYGKESKKIASFIIPISWIGIIASQIMGAALIISKLTTLSYVNGIIISGIFFIIYTFLGGQLSILKTDFVQLLFILLGLLLCFIYVRINTSPVKALPLISERFTITDFFIMLFTYSTTYFVGPDIYGRVFCAKDTKTAKKSILICISVLFPLAYILGYLGIQSSKFVDNSVANQSLLFLIENYLPKLLVAPMYFCLFSAVISSADTCLLSASSMFTQFFYGNLQYDSSIKKTRFFIVLLGLASIYIALNMKHIIGTIMLAYTIFTGAFIIPTIFGILGYRVSKIYVNSAIILGGALALFGKLYGDSNANYYVIAAFILNTFVITLPKFLNIFKIKKERETSI